ncbi:HAMP domain-containing protein [Rhodobacterales bacterium LSUCC1028]|jgi:two-component system nitrogen regulation sensor histidine kinase NtrY|nr:HAMP domain-containing protein [Rhodobacterales bacterium FZCC0188]MBF9053101.1 HAMP domain-containing protein [Rhodobacterales bacterium LSUCC1028]
MGDIWRASGEIRGRVCGSRKRQAGQVAKPSNDKAISAWRRLILLQSTKRLRNAGTLGLVTLGPVLALLTFLVLGPLGDLASSPALRLILLADLVYILVIAALVARQVVRMIAARRSRSQGSRLHMRLTGVFAIVALLPTILVAVFATITLNMGLEGWFSTRVSGALGNSVDAAIAYQQEHRTDLDEDARALAAFLDNAARNDGAATDGDLRRLLGQGQGLIQRGLREAYVISATGEIRARGERSYLFDYDQPSDADLIRAAEGEVVLIEDRAQNEFRALLKLSQYLDRYLYVSREVDGQIMSLLDETQQTVQLYRQLENERGRVLFEFGLLYIGFALIVIMAAIWLGLWFAERLSRPVGRLAAAAERIGDGDLEARVPEEKSGDEIATLGRVFNQMTLQLKAQRDRLVEQNDRTEGQRRLFDSVLGSVTAGVIGVTAEGDVEFINRSAQRLLSLSEDELQHHGALAALVPEFADLPSRLRERGSDTLQEELRLTRNGAQETLLVRIAVRGRSDGAIEGYVVAFDDVSDLVAAQRMAAWGDVARRIAHEIKNPLTPIRLSAERAARKFTKILPEEDGQSLKELTDVIVRQTNDLAHIVDEFSRFARMPEPSRRREDIAKLLEGVVTLQRAGQPEVEITLTKPEGEIWAEIDATMIGQAFTNLIKNAGEAIETYCEKHPQTPHHGEIRVALGVETGAAQPVLKITISDNGIGLPEDRARLFEPYVTTREKGTGLGLPIVKKIIEEHGASLELRDAPPFGDGAHQGAQAVIHLPLMIG